MAKTKVLAGRVNGETYDQVLEIASKDGLSPNDFVKEAIKNSIADHEKLAHPEKLMPAPDAKHLKIENVEPEGEINPDEFVEGMWDSFVSYAKDKGYSLIKTDTLRMFLDVIELREGIKPTKEAEEENFDCGKCGQELIEGNKFCSGCGVELNWDDVSGKKSEEEPEREKPEGEEPEGEEPEGEPLNCAKCGAELNRDMKTCPSCGAELNWNDLKE